MFDKLLKLFSKTVEESNAEKPKQSIRKQKSKKKQQSAETQLSEKELATQRGDPYVSILRMDVDPENVHAGSFELDFNDKFVLNLVRAGYKRREDDTDNMIVDRWFQTVCRNIALEMYEQEQADPKNRVRGEHDIRQVKTKKLDNNRTEIS